jgi:hypothetical protein
MQNVPLRSYLDPDDDEKVIEGKDIKTKAGFLGLHLTKMFSLKLIIL